MTVALPRSSAIVLLCMNSPNETTCLLKKIVTVSISSYLCIGFQKKAQYKEHILFYYHTKEKKMKKIIFTIAAALTFTVSMAQNKQGNNMPQNAEQMTSQMKSKMKLSDDQLKQVKALNESYSDLFKRPEMPPRDDNRQGASNKKGNKQNASNKQDNGQQPKGRPEMTDEMKQQMQQRQSKQQEYEKKLKAIVGDEQYATYEKQLKPQGPGRMGGKPNASTSKSKKTSKSK